MPRWPRPSSVKAAVKKWGQNATVALNIARVESGLGILITFDRDPDPYNLPDLRTSPIDGDIYVRFERDGPPEEPIAIRFSGEPAALLYMFEQLHRQYIKTLIGRDSRKKRKRRRLIL